ncbi:shikimate dehydrogenase [[Haemophilus] ducreyi]|uniref:Shikimate dehydrogenase (NADP(+)) n=2 Tax=Haemophilus ducreyi TaxID=730 RepID=AROE_HAEDU|nr:shikimate dehydrogenase [[Haemophilus] ducreyi]Q7VNS2.1 RecName: Full=Shikimate dehydrogenase (NADP(+)); Short=SDH [[Haemophilus] ducreyi 35000HP]AAP95380.1 dehydroshikimate reductase [[Haemophilus] ducreyi 35000HP]AKO30501.1 shikimate dehydrogenase [[Haemophilus] ducreyi]AKO31936.1 shikimate dehydrogenase [[Haemophilus] ducreyi]AKO33390.1 shikimate dehydrogenase [[Haemophilus] ducreyi]AKO34838.1 shikimate dehydrogenase [[Haemophilus] ducreyi]
MARQYAVWGNPIAHSKSPYIHQLFAQQSNRRIEYAAKLGDKIAFEKQLVQFFTDGANGVNITSPFKARAFRLADVCSESCLLAGAANTLKRLDDGRLFADNTDGKGFCADLARLEWLIPEQRVLILGAGGVTKGVLLPLLLAKQKVTLSNRTHIKAVELAQQFAKYGDIQAVSLSEIVQHPPFDLIINATSLGLQGGYIALPNHLFEKSAVYDMEYASNMCTPFLNYVRTQGVTRYQDGLGMLVNQAAFSFQLWEGELPKVENVLKQLRAEMGYVK